MDSFDSTPIRRNFGNWFEKTSQEYEALEKRLADEERARTNPVAPTNPAPQAPVTNPTPVPVITPIRKDTSKDFIQVGINGIHGTPVLISPYEFAGSNNMNYENTHKFVLEKGLYVPTPRIFMTFFSNVMKAYEERKKTSGFKLHDYDGKPLGPNEVSDLYLHLTKNHKNMFGRADVGAWTWLNSRFVAGKGYNKLGIETINGLDKKGKFVTSISPLELCEWSDSYTTFDFNTQGLATKKDSNQNYNQGKNIRFWYPRKDCVARFFAGSVWACLYCGRYPSAAGGGLGVYVCAEGAVGAKK